MATKINDNEKVYKYINKGQNHWYKVKFTEEGKVNFSLQPQVEDLDVDLYLCSSEGESSYLARSAKSKGKEDLISQYDVEADKNYYVRVKGYSGSGKYLLRCNTNESFIWNYLTEELSLSETHTAAIMGNMKVESNFYPTNAQDSSYSGADNPEYIEVYDNKDGIGWGLLQWTYWSRKRDLYNYADEKGTSVGDLVTQLEFMKVEFDSSYKKQYDNFLKKTDLEEATRYFCTNIEQAGTPHMDRRIEAAKEISEKY